MAMSVLVNMLLSEFCLTPKASSNRLKFEGHQNLLTPWRFLSSGGIEKEVTG
jgi:hypothetical protein